MRHVFLIGLSGSGKSTVGRFLAQQLDRPLFDIDTLIEKECGERITDLFAKYGEAYFRECESRILAQIAQQSDHAIIVTGGGIVVQPENRALMAAHGTRIFLQVDPQVSVQRLLAQYEREHAAGQAPELRPLLAGPDPFQTLQNLFNTREAWYREAEITCVTTEKSIEQVVQEIITMLTDAENANRAPDPIVRHVHIGAGYDAVVEWGGLQRLAAYLVQLQVPKRVFIITDSNIYDVYAKDTAQQLIAAGFEPHTYCVPAGEGSKSQQQVTALYDWLLEYQAERREVIIAIGGGVIGDLAGFVAATYLRGVPLIQVPTSLLAQVDAAIGGKTGINHPRGKNLIGAFYHPRLVLVDPATLLTLPERSRTEGWAEIVKYGIILDADLFTLLEEHVSALRDFTQPLVALLCQIVARCIDLKVTVIEEDEKEQSRRAILNYGHTVGHALENASGYGEWLHGEAVSIGMVVAAMIACQAGMFAESDVLRQNQLLAAFGLPVTYQGTVQAQDILERMQLDKKVVGKKVRWIMPERIGEVIVTPMPDDLVGRVISAYFVGEKV
ncbi:MAG TPA: 3-dehydroquinate synthase [Dictyobacter sp.]|jgi:3-dehydroquinate synthase|nr:3-dehydroquinate synthase [Dictyobacter sp.]